MPYPIPVRHRGDVPGGGRSRLHLRRVQAEVVRGERQPTAAQNAFGRAQLRVAPPAPRALVRARSAAAYAASVDAASPSHITAPESSCVTVYRPGAVSSTVIYAQCASRSPTLAVSAHAIRFVVVIVASTPNSMRPGLVGVNRITLDFTTSRREEGGGGRGE